MELSKQRVFPGGSVVKNAPSNAGDMVRSLGQEDPLEEEMGIHSQYSRVRNPMDREAWQVTIHGATKESDTTEGLTVQPCQH